MKWKLVAALAILCVLGFVWFWRSGSFGNSLRTRELATRGLAAYLVEKFPGQCAVIMSNPFTQQKGLPKEIVAQEEAGIRGVREGLGKQVRVGVAYPELKPEAKQNPGGVSMIEGATTPLSFMVAEGSFDKIANEHTGCDLIVSLIGIPTGFDQLKIWQPSDTHRFGLLLPDLRILGDLATLRRAIETRKIAAFVLNKPGAPPEQERFSGSWKAEFERRFVLVTSENFEQMLREYPQAFELGRESLNH